MFSFAKGSSVAAIFCTLRSVFILGQLYPPEINIKFIGKPAIRPFPPPSYDVEK